MSDLEDVVETAMTTFSPRRPLFHSEADFQLALAWELQRSHPEAELRLEKRVIDDPRVELDILFMLGGRRYGLELKYSRAEADVDVDGERFVLRSGAPYLEPYNVLLDIARLERLVAEAIVDEGCVVALTNAAAIWQPAQRERLASYDAFRIHEGREVAGSLEWGPTASEGIRKGREDPIVLRGTYRCSWRDFSDVGVVMRYLLVPVTALPAPPDPAERLA